LEQDVKNIRIEDYNYELPDERIARYPVSPRDSSKLLVFKNGEITDTQYNKLHKYLPAKTLLLFNQTKVVQARLKFPKNERTTIEIFCLEPHNKRDIQQAMQCTSPIEYKCLVGGARKWKGGLLHLTTEDGETLSAEKVSRENDAFIIQFSWTGSSHFAEILEKAGKTPLPPYLNRDAEESDRDTYQTLFAKNDGSVAAPTAGLHFTEKLLKKLDEKGIQEEFITLHVGAGTFKPVSSETMSEHEMHSEEFFIERQLLDVLLDNLDKPIIPVGTTSLRALESLYWLGVKLLRSKNTLEEYHVTQWEPYQNAHLPEIKDALQAIAIEMSGKGVEMLTAKTQLIIAPGYKHRICRGLLTNFHQPKSTLLLLVASFIGKDWQTIYKHALANHYRFLSYGDGCLILNDN
jgi:S-adenosylmethionine:tRNA ribosyltransferase-isomerase